MRRLLVLVSTIMLVDTTFYTALTPLLPHYVDELGISKAGAGVLIAAFGAGVLVGSIPAGMLAVRVGVKPVVILGLSLLSATSLAFAFAETAWILDAARFLQGVGGACTWTGALGWLVAEAPRERRGQLIGTAVGAGIAGALLGPVVGAAAGIVGTGPAFLVVAVVGVAIIGAVATFPGVRPTEGQTLLGALRAIGEPLLARGMWLVALPAILFGSLTVLAPLRLDELGFGTAAIGAAFLASAAIESAASPLIGRIYDRRGGAVLLRAGLPAAALVSVALPLAQSPWTLAALVALTGIAYGTFWVAAMSFLAEGAEEARLDASFAFAFMNLAWAAGQAVGSSLGGALGERLGDAVPYLAGAALCCATLALVVRRGVGVVTAATAGGVEEA